VCVWDDQVDLFEHAVAKYGTVDIVVRRIAPLGSTRKADAD
jgi:hypothetical protein